MRFPVLVFLTMTAAGVAPAFAQNAWLDSRMITSICNSKPAPAGDADALTKRLKLTTDAQKAALKDLVDASASAAATTKTALCADKPDFSTAPGRMAFSGKMAEARATGINAIEPKLKAFYDTLDAKQKTAFDTGGRVGGFFDWWK